MITRLPAVLYVLPLLTWAACDDESAILTRALFDLTRAEQELYAIPYPNDARLEADGTIDLAGLRQGQTELIQLYLDTAVSNRLGGFALGGAVFLRFASAIDPDRCAPKTAAQSVVPGSSIALVNIDKRSPHRGSRVPVTWRYQASAGKFIGEHSLAVLPLPGFVLDPWTTYAAMVTDAMCDPLGDPVHPDADFERMLRSNPPEDQRLARAHAAYAPLREHITTTGANDIISAAVFTTGDPTRLAGLARKVIHTLPAPGANGAVLTEEHTRYWVIEGTYLAPNFQSGSPPYAHPEDGGTIKLDGQGLPMVQRMESLRFALSVPRGGTMPAAGWPVVLYAHGTGGSYRSFLDGGVASALAEVKDEAGNIVSRLAVAGIDQVLHGPRAPQGSSPEVFFFNFQNPVAAVDNVIQGGIDDFSLLRMIRGLSLDSVRWSGTSGKQGTVIFDPPLRFDPGSTFFMGHSQGGLTGPVFLAYEPDVRTAVLSGAGGNAMLSLLKSTPINVGTLLQLVLHEPVTEFHPMVNLLQQILEPADTANYGHMLLHNRATGVAPHNLFVSEGLVDHYTPNETTDALARAVGLPQAGSILYPVQGLELLDLPATTLSLPLSGNLTVDGTAVTAALLQYRAGLGSETCKADSDCSDDYYCELSASRCASDGHFVVYRNTTAIRQYTRFLATAARDGTPSIVR